MADAVILLNLLVDKNTVPLERQEQCHHLQLQKFIGILVGDIVLLQHGIQQGFHLLLTFFDENYLAGTGKLFPDILVGIPVKIGKYLRHTIYGGSFAGNKTFIACGVGVSGGDQKNISCCQMIEMIIDRVDTASGFQVKYLHIVMKMLVTHGEAWYTNLPFNVNSIIIFLCIHAVSFPIKN